MLRTVGFLVFLAGPAWACPDYNAVGYSIDVSGIGLGKPLQYTIIAGGDGYLSHCNITLADERGDGYFPATPHLSLTLRDMAYQRVSITAEAVDCDTSLLVNAPDTQWFFNDDAGYSFNPQIKFVQVFDGKMDIWVGTFDGHRCEALLTIQNY